MNAKSEQRRNALYRALLTRITDEHLISHETSLEDIFAAPGDAKLAAYSTMADDIGLLAANAILNDVKEGMNLLDAIAKHMTLAYQCGLAHACKALAENQMKREEAS